jgi:hypothetical protein
MLTRSKRFEQEKSSKNSTNDKTVSPNCHIDSVDEDYDDDDDSADEDYEDSAEEDDDTDDDMVDDDDDMVDDDMDDAYDGGVEKLIEIEISRNPELRDSHENLNREIKLADPTLKLILNTKIKEKDKQYLLQLYGIYLNTIPHTEENLEMKKRIKKNLKEYKKDYVIYSQQTPNRRVSEDIKNISTMGYSEQGIKFKIYNLNTSIQNKAIMYEKYKELRQTDKTDESRAKILKWLSDATSLPYDNLHVVSTYNNNVEICRYLNLVRTKLNSELYGMNEIKEKLLLYIHSRLINPTKTSASLGLVGSPGCGKCLARDTPVLMWPFGVSFVQDIKPYQTIMGDDGTPRNVLNVCRGRETMYRIDQDDGDPYTVNESHILSLMVVKNPRVNDKTGTVDVVNRDSISRFVVDKNIYSDINLWSAYYKPLIKNSLHKGDVIDISVREYITRCDKWKKHFTGYKSIIDYGTIPTTLPTIDVEWIRNFVDTLNVNTKLIPPELKYSNFGYRNIFTMIMEKIHTPNLFTPRTQNIKFHTTFTHPSNNLMEDVIFIYRSLGYTVIRSNDTSSVDISDMWGVKQLYNTSEIKLTRLEEGDYFGFQIDGNKRFVLGDFTVTHNTAITKALSNALHIPFAQISFGGIESPSYITGQDYTYIGSHIGEITRCMRQLMCKNGIIFFDEYEKSATNKNISSALLHITDPIQNNKFKDQYLSGITQDLSNIWFIYSMNKLPDDSALRDRIDIVHVNDYTIDDKVNICKDFFIPKFMEEQMIDMRDVIISSEVIKYLVNRVSNGEKGVRQLRFFIKDIISKIKYLFTYKFSETRDPQVSFFTNVTKPFNVTTRDIDCFTKSLVDKQDVSHTMMYM